MNMNLDVTSTAANPLVIERVIADATTRLTKGAELFRRGLIRPTSQPGVYEAVYTVNINLRTCTCPDFSGKPCRHLRLATREPYRFTPSDDPNILLLIYNVNLLERTCTCPDAIRPEGGVCKHGYGAEMLERVLRMVENVIPVTDDLAPIDFAA